MKDRNPIRKKRLKPWQRKMHTVIFEADTFGGKLFDIILLVAILISIFAVMMESVKEVSQNYGTLLFYTEWILTLLFTLEYFARIICVGRPFYYIFSFYGLVDLLSILPVYVGVFIPHNTHSLSVIRSLRLLRVFRILKLGRFLGEASLIKEALVQSRVKITVFLFAVLSIVTIMGTVMYIVEPEEAGFTSIPTSIYWAIVTLTTVGYGDIAPITVLGQMLSSLIMIIGYAIIAVPTGIVTSEINNAMKKEKRSNTQHCPNCSKEDHDDNAIYCKHCGEPLN